MRTTTTKPRAGAAKTKPQATVVDGRVVVRDDPAARAEWRRRRANPQVTADVAPYTSTTTLTAPGGAFVGSMTSVYAKHEGKVALVEVRYDLPEWPAALELVKDLR